MIWWPSVCSPLRIQSAIEALKFRLGMGKSARQGRFRRGRRANHQTAAIVPNAPNRVIGFFINERPIASRVTEANHVNTTSAAAPVDTRHGRFAWLEAAS